MEHPTMPHPKQMQRAGNLAFILWLAAGSPALAAGDAAAGHELARLWCASCHLVDGSARGPDTAPPFATIAQNNRSGQGWLRAWLKAPHPPMPNFNLSRQQIDDIVSYLDSLSPR